MDSSDETTMLDSSDEGRGQACGRSGLVTGFVVMTLLLGLGFVFAGRNRVISPTRPQGRQVRLGSPVRLRAAAFNSGQKPWSFDTWPEVLNRMLGDGDANVFVLGVQEMHNKDVRKAIIQHLTSLGFASYAHRYYKEWSVLCAAEHFNSALYVFAKAPWRVQASDESVYPRACERGSHGRKQPYGDQGCWVSLPGSWNPFKKECGKVINVMHVTVTKPDGDVFTLGLGAGHWSFKKSTEQRIELTNKALDVMAVLKPDALLLLGDFNSRMHCRPVGSKAQPFWTQLPEEMLSSDESAQMAADELRRSLNYSYGGPKAECFDDDGEKYPMANSLRSAFSAMKEVGTLEHPTYKIKKTAEGWPRSVDDFDFTDGGENVQNPKLKHRPAFTDRIVLWAPEALAVEPLSYTGIPSVIGSDHDAVAASLEAYCPHCVR